MHMSVSSIPIWWLVFLVPVIVLFWKLYDRRQKKLELKYRIQDEEIISLRRQINEMQTEKTEYIRKILGNLVLRLQEDGCEARLIESEGQIATPKEGMLESYTLFKVNGPRNTDYSMSVFYYRSDDTLCLVINQMLWISRSKASENFSQILTEVEVYARSNFRIRMKASK